MTIRSSVLQTAVFTVFAVLIGACSAADTVSAAGDDGADDTAVEAASAAPSVAALPYTSGFGLSTRIVSRPFMVRDHTALTVTAEAKWAEPESCHLSTFAVTLFEASAQGLGHPLTSRTFPISGATHVEVWPKLAAGEYAVELSAANSDSKCHLIGKIGIADK